ncbi:hypothetical protein BJV78DRAFT_1182749 [Lactifluus subvellereus]|nr:hypothetical protein BJV78DRAFT_1182749 [Lactifluus subvellereus]
MSVTVVARRTFATFAFASSSRLRAHKTSRSLTTSPATFDEQPWSSATTKEPFPEIRSADPSTPRPQPSVSQGTRPLLQPYELSRRLIALCRRGDADLAVDMLQRAPKNAQNIKVWNTLIQQCMDAKKYKLAFRVFTDVRALPRTPCVAFSVVSCILFLRR